MSDENTYEPTAGSLPARVVDFFRENPDEELTRRDMADKFEIPAASVDACLKKAIDAGLLATKNNEEMVRCWVAGPQISKARPAAAAKKARAPRAVKEHSALDISSIQIETNVEKPEPKTGHSPIYTELLNRMKPGNSVLLPLYNARRLMEWGRKTAKRNNTNAKYSLRKVGEDQARVWRDS